MSIYEKLDPKRVNILTDKRVKPRTLILSLISTFAALNIMADLIPFTPILGVPGASFRLGWVLAPLTGIMLGPVAGGLSCIIASLVELFLGVQLWSFGVFSPFRAGLSAFQAGLLISGKWKTSVTVLVFLMFMWIFLPSGREALIVLSFHVFSLILILIFRSNIKKYANSPVLWKTALSLATASYCGNISRHLFGNVLLIWLTGIPSSIFLLALPLTLTEQFTFTTATTILVVALSRTHIRELTDSF